jgi:hypothetical protein
MEKFIYNRSENDKENHWNICEKNKTPFIVIDDKGKIYSEIFYDITNIARTDQLQLISDKVKSFYSSYIEFSYLEVSSLQKYFDEYYFFDLVLKKIV